MRVAPRRLRGRSCAVLPWRLRVPADAGRPHPPLTNEPLDGCGEPAALYFPAMQFTTTPGPKSTVLLEVELPPERLTRSIDDAVRRLAKRVRVPGFRPGKAPRPVLERHLGPGVVLDEAVEHL